MEAQLGYTDEKESGLQKPKKSLEIQVWKPPVAGPPWKVWAELGQVWFPGLVAGPGGADREQAEASGVEGAQPGASSLPRIPAEARVLPSLSF